MTRVSTPQTRHCLEPVSASEYDAALCSSPSRCLPAASGDLRTGRQLLADAAADAARPVRRLAQTPRGRAALDAMAERLEAALGRLPPLPPEGGEPPVGAPGHGGPRDSDSP